MTTTTTPRDFLSPGDETVPDDDSPGVSRPARAIITTTEGNSNRKPTASSKKSWLGRQSFWMSPPVSLDRAWSASTVDPRRIPNDSAAFRRLWMVSNATDRLVLFALILIAPGILQGPLRHLVQRPTRRYGLYFVLVALTSALIVGSLIR